MLTRKKISVVPIAYRDEGNIQELYRRVVAALKKITPNWEIVYVNDSSPDNSEKILRKLASRDKRLTVVIHSRNFGAQNAFTSGMKQASGEAIVLMDGDLQDPPELIEKFVEKWLAGYQVVYGRRKRREKSMGPLWEYIYHMFYIIFNKLSYIKVPLDAGDFSLMDRVVVDHLNSLPEKDRFIRGLRAWVGFKQIGIDYIRPERYWGTGVSTNSFLKGMQWARKAIFSFSFAPLEWVFYAAILSVFVSLFGIFFYFTMYFIVPNAPRGFMTILLAVLFIGSIQLVFLSLISEYIRRIFEEVKNRPEAIIKEVINNHRKK